MRGEERKSTAIAHVCYVVVRQTRREERKGEGDECIGFRFLAVLLLEVQVGLESRSVSVRAGCS
jgi:hypothetical protein